MCLLNHTRAHTNEVARAAAAVGSLLAHPQHHSPMRRNNAMAKQRNGASTVPSGSASPALVHVRQPASSCDTTRSPPTPGVSARRCRVMASGRIPWGAKSSHHCTRGHRRAAPVAHARRLVWGGLPKFSRKL